MTDARTTVTAVAERATANTTQLFNDLQGHLASARETVADLGERLPGGVSSAFERWVTEGQHLVTAWIRDASRRGRSLERMVADRSMGGEGAESGATSFHADVRDIDGIGPVYGDLLGAAGVETTADLVGRCSTDTGVAQLERDSGISATMLRGWCASGDLSRITGIGPGHFADLNAVGIATIEHLAHADPRMVHERLAQHREEDASDLRAPSADTVRAWIEAAGELVR